MKRIHILITGRVQGVFYRENCKKAANKLGLVGWARNNPDGTVEVVAEGEEPKLKELLEWCKRGSPSSSVEKVNFSFEEATGEFEGFEY